jgi:parallel beta-helix repeat protein
MLNIRVGLPTLALLFGLCTAPAHAAEGDDNCVGFIDALPATISTQGTWCLRQDLSTAITSGAAVTVTTHNVTIDCNDHKIGGLTAGTSSSTDGIRSLGYLNTTVRRCAIRGFRFGISMSGSGHLVEDNRLDQNLVIGIFVSGEPDNRVQRNRVFDTGGKPGNAYASGISANADVFENVVSGVFATATNTIPNGIELYGDGTAARGNEVRDLVVAGAGSASGITGYNKAQSIVDNHVSNGATAGWGITGIGTAYTICSRNQVAGFNAGTIKDCLDGGGNVGL